ncbi:MAG: amino acid racemase, partial [Clostridia bacterium]|nr:amino acid racemase [Clostridia bacterium]
GIIKLYSAKYGSDVYPEIVIDSVNMGKLLGLMGEGRFDEAAAIITKSIMNLKNADADFSAVASNTPHMMWERFGITSVIPVISIVKATCDYIIAKRYKCVVIFATEFTMKNGLYAKALNEMGITAITPSQEDMKELGNIIYPNLENGIVIENDKKRMTNIAERYIHDFKADALLLGCTEIPLMIKQEDISVPVINTTQIHIEEIMKELF